MHVGPNYHAWESIKQYLERFASALFLNSYLFYSFISNSYVTEHMEVAGAGASIATNLYKTYDVPSLLSHLLQLEPWQRTDDKGDLQTFNCEFNMAENWFRIKLAHCYLTLTLFERPTAPKCVTTIKLEA